MTDSTKILSFTRRRGRPKSNRPQIDTGTPETIMKRLLGLTTEVLDLCLERGIIDRKQHWCGIHLRWLYTLRYGVPSVRSTDLSGMNNRKHGGTLDNDDPEWRTEREKEYNEAIERLNNSGYALLIINICIYNERPKSLDLNLSLRQNSQANAKQDIKKLRDGLDILVKLWKYS